MDFEKKIREAIENEWLGLGDTSKLQVTNPFHSRSQEDIENPHVWLLNKMRQPEYFAFTCKWLLNIDLPPIQQAILRELWIRPFPMLIGARGMGKTFIEALYAVLRATFCQGVKIVVVGAAFRQAKYVLDYVDKIWKDAPVLRDLCGNDSRNGPRIHTDRITHQIGDSRITGLPMGSTGQKIRGERGQVIINDEFASGRADIFENVVSGFASVHADPVEKLKAAARKRAMERFGVPIVDEIEGTIPGLTSNQIVISGTAFYAFNHFYDYWKRYKSIIESKGDRNVLRELFKGELDETFDWRDYSIIRVPCDLLPAEFMDPKQITRSRATFHKSQFLMEFGACFVADSHGFFKRSAIENCVVGKPGCDLPTFTACLRGSPGAKYVFGVDPASERDNFSIVILELHGDHRRIVYTWTANRKKYRKSTKRKPSEDGDFIGFVARKIRRLVKLFPPTRIAMDTQGGGWHVLEALQYRVPDGETPILEVIDYDKPKETDSMKGEHVVEMINFASAQWTSDANHGLKTDIENKALLFPEFDALRIALSLEEDEAMGRTSDNLNDVEDNLEEILMEVEGLKDELTSIVHTQTSLGQREHWDTPENRLEGGKKGRARKDRYSALLMANMSARTYHIVTEMAAPEYEITGGFAHDLKGKRAKPESSHYHKNPDWYTNKVGDGSRQGAVVLRNRG